MRLSKDVVEHVCIHPLFPVPRTRFCSFAVNDSRGTDEVRQVIQRDGEKVTPCAWADLGRR